MRYKEGIEVEIKSNRFTPASGHTGIIERIEEKSYVQYWVKIDGEDAIYPYFESEIEAADIMNEPVDEPIRENIELNFTIDDYFSEMATIALKDGMNININQEIDKLSIAYFKVYDHSNVNAAKRVVRLHFKDSGMEYHRDPLGKQPWKLNSKDIKNIIGLLKKPYRSNRAYTNWQAACFQWNSDNGLIPSSVDIDEYFAGRYDNQHFNDTRLENAYVPSTQKMPDTWIYDPSKGKK